MGFRGALVDRARRVVREPLPERVEGTTQFVTVHYPWFRCRFSLDAAPDTDATPQPGYRRVPQNAQLMCGMKDVDGGVLDLKATDRIEVDSKELGHAMYEATSAAQPIRKKRRMLGHTMTLMRVEENPFEQAEP